MNYKVNAESHIGPVAYSIVTEIVESDVVKFLTKGVLYEAQRIAASKAVKALGGGRRANLVYNDEAREAVESALTAVFGDSAEIDCSEHVKGLRPEIKHAQARKVLANNKGREQKVADRVGFDGELFEAGDFAIEFLAAITEWINNPFENDEDNA